MAIADSPRQLHIEITTRCNLQCKMCVKFADGVSIPEQDFPFLLFQNMKKELKGVERLILNGIGEPLLHPQLEDFVAFARRQMPEKSEIGFQTNGLLMTEKRAESLVDAGLDLVCFSVDTLDAVKDGTLHAPASSKTGKAVEWFSGKDGVSVGVEVVLMRDTIEQLPLIVEWAAQAGADFVIGSHVMPYDPSMSEQSLFDHHTCGARELINEFKQRAAREGIPLEFARGSSLLNKRYSNEVQFYDWLKDLQKEAAARKEWLDVHRNIKNCLVGFY